MGKTTPSFLVVDDDPIVRRALARVLRRYGSCRAAASLAAARAYLRTDHWDGFIIDIGLGDGSGLDLLAHLRESQGNAPAIVLSATLERETVNRVAMLDARFVCKPWGPRELAPFLSDVILRAKGDRISSAAERARLRWRLSARETEILKASLGGRSREVYLSSVDITVNTYKTHVRNLLQKADYETLSSLAIDLLGES